VDTNLFNNSVMVLPVLTQYIVDAAPSGLISYWVNAFTLTSGRTDHTAAAKFNVLRPGLTVVHGPLLSNPAESNYFFGEQFWKDAPTATGTPALKVLRQPGAYRNQGGKGLLLLHQYNRFGKRAQVVGTK
jgi:hypothetical protein